ncbi:TPA: hypothetical protein DCX16_05635 [bacterium]|nr:hypothetical protein [bacterium]
MANVGNILREKRENLGFTIEEIERRLNVSKRFIIAIEKEDISTFPKISYYTSIMRNYARFLGFSDPEIANMIRDFSPKIKQSKYIFFNITYIIILLLVLIAFLIFMAIIYER